MTLAFDTGYHLLQRKEAFYSGTRSSLFQYQLSNGEKQMLVMGYRSGAVGLPTRIPCHRGQS